MGTIGLLLVASGAFLAVAELRGLRLAGCPSCRTRQLQPVIAETQVRHTALGITLESSRWCCACGAVVREFEQPGTATQRRPRRGWRGAAVDRGRQPRRTTPVRPSLR